MGKTILAVDDSATVLALVKSVLEKDGFSVIMAKDGQECLEAMRTAAPDLILLDIEMPKMDGYTTLREIRYGDRKTRNIPVVMLTSKGRLEDIFFLEGATDFIEKSQSAFQTLSQKLTAVLDNA